jgi:TatA/E family protein of Tat protein translocase|tara:strand:+ start:190 stop:447 length:258 start_codon:yes stop_codon:yes gene_type:complete
MLMTNSLAFIGGLGGPEIAVIFVIVLLLFGAKKIPELARGLGKSMGEFKRAREEFEDEIRTAEMEVETEEKTKEAKHKEEASEVS